MTAPTVKPGDILTTTEQCLALPPGALCADRDGDPVLRAADQRWCLGGAVGGTSSVWSVREYPVSAFLPWRVVALDCSPDLGLAEAIRTVLACPDVHVRHISDTATKVLGVARERGETDEQYRVRVVAGAGPAVSGLAAAQAALRAIDPEAILSVEDGPTGGLAVRARVSPACDLAAAARVLWERLPVTTETRGEWLEVVCGPNGDMRHVRLDPRPARVGEVVPAMLVPDRAVAEVVGEGTCPRLRWGTCGTVITGPADGSAPREQWGKLCTPIHRQGGWSWPGASEAKTLHRVLAVDVPMSACAAPAEMCRLLGWDAPAPAPAQPQAAVGDVVPLDRLPVGGVAGRADSPGEIAIRRAPQRAQFATSARLGGYHGIWPRHGGSTPAPTGDWRILALGVDPQATASAVVDLVADELARVAGLVRDGDRLRALRVGDEIPTEAAPKGSITRPLIWRDTYTARHSDGGGWHVLADLSNADSKRMLAGKAGWWNWPSMVPSGRAAVVALDVPDEAWTDRARLAALLGAAAPAAVPTPATLAVGAIVADEAAAEAVPPGTLLMDSGGDAVFRTLSNAGDEDEILWRVLAPECDWDDDTWADCDERPDNYLLPWRVVATGLPADLSETEAIERVRAFDLEQLRAAGIDAVAGPALPPRAVGVARSASERTFVRLADGTGWECDAAGDVPSPGGGGWEWDLCAPMRVLARDLTDEDCIAVTRMDEAAIVAWARTRAGAPAVAAAVAPQAPGVGDEVAVRDLPRGSIGYEAGRECYIARRADGRYWWFRSVRGDTSARDLLLGRAGWHQAPSSQGASVRIAAAGASDADLRDPAWLRAHLGAPEGCAWAESAAVAPAAQGAVVAAVAAPAPQAGAVVPACEVPSGWLVAQQDIARAWHVAEGRARCVLDLGGWRGHTGSGWRWPVPGTSGVVSTDAQVRLVAPWPATEASDEADYVARVCAWRESAPRLSPQVAAEMACAIAAGAIGPRARGNVAGQTWILGRVLPLCEQAGALLTWHPSGPRAHAANSDGATAAVAWAARDFALMRTSPLHAWAALRSLAGAPASVREWLLGARTSAAWQCGGLTCEVGHNAWQIDRPDETARGATTLDRLSAAAAMIDHLLGLALDAPPIRGGVERAGERSYTWVGAVPADADRPYRLGPLILAPGRAAGFAVGTTSADATGAAMTDVATLTARLARTSRVRSLGVTVAAPRAMSPEDAAGVARDAVATLDAAGALP